jgi:hypothetical protein
VVAKILDISDTGLVSIVFDKSLKVRNITDIDLSSLKILMVPNKNAGPETQEKLKNFVWKCVKFEKNLIQIQIMFDTPSYVSYEGLDLITMEVLNHMVFRV